jgi:hypothetical protein
MKMKVKPEQILQKIRAQGIFKDEDLLLFLEQSEINRLRKAKVIE